MPTPPEPTPPSDEVNSADYDSLTEAIAAVPDNGTVVLAEDTAVPTIEIAGGKTLTLDLNGKTLSAEKGAAVLKITDGVVDITNGTIKTTSGRAITIDTRTSKGNVEVNIGADATVASSGNLAVAIFGENTLNIEGKVSASNTEYATIQGNGNATSAGSVINIADGAEIVSENGMAMYIPQKCEINVKGGTITAQTNAIYCKSGQLNISGGTISSLGESKAEYQPATDGAHETADAVLIDNCDYPGGVPEVSISGGTIQSAHAKSVASYAKEGLEPVTGFITGGVFSSDVTDLCAEGYKAIKSGSNWTVVKVS